MNNFMFSIPTKVYFGKGEVSNLPSAIKEYGNKVLLVYGGGSIKKIGLYDQIISLLKANNIKWVELSGVDPNPRVSSVNEGVKLCRENGIEVILPVGGGSCLDCAKAIAASVDYNGDAWDIVTGKAEIKSALPIITVLTLSATGSELNTNAVISNPDTDDKVPMSHPLVLPKCSILDPTYTFTVSKYQTAAGTADIISHIFEVYFDENKSVFFQDSMAEAMLKTCFKYGKVAYENPNDYDARANLMWTSSLAICGLISQGKFGGPWDVHQMEHQLSAYYDITHGVGLAILTPRWMRHILDKNLNKFVAYGVNVWGISDKLDKKEIANLAIEKTSDFFKELNIPSTLGEVNINEEHFDAMAKKCPAGNLSDKDIISIFKACL